MAQDRRMDRFLVRNDTSKFLNTLLENPDLPENRISPERAPLPELVRFHK